MYFRSLRVRSSGVTRADFQVWISGVTGTGFRLLWVWISGITCVDFRGHGTNFRQFRRRISGSYGDGLPKLRDGFLGSRVLTGFRGSAYGFSSLHERVPGLGMRVFGVKGPDFGKIYSCMFEVCLSQDPALLKLTHCIPSPPTHMAHGCAATGFSESESRDFSKCGLVHFRNMMSRSE